MKPLSEKQLWDQKRKDRIMAMVFPDRIAPSARIMRSFSCPEPSRHQ